MSSASKMSTSKIECNKCKKVGKARLIDPKQWRRHIDEHLMRYECINPWCGKSFTRNSSLQRHRLNCRDKRYACDDCGQDYASRQILKRHHAKCGIRLARLEAAVVDPAEEELVAVDSMEEAMAAVDPPVAAVNLMEEALLVVAADFMEAMAAVDPPVDNMEAVRVVDPSVVAVVVDPPVVALDHMEEVAADLADEAVVDPLVVAAINQLPIMSPVVVDLPMVAAVNSKPAPKRKRKEWPPAIDREIIRRKKELPIRFQNK